MSVVDRPWATSSMTRRSRSVSPYASAISGASSAGWPSSIRTATEEYGSSPRTEPRTVTQFPCGERKRARANVSDGSSLRSGAVPVAIATAHDHLTGGGFDLPPVEPIFNSYVARFGLADRLSFTPGDFFADPLPSADVLIMGHILHDWDLDQKRLLLQKAYAALPMGGVLIVFDAIIDDDRRENAFGLLMSLNMLIEALGFDYTGADCRGWMAEVGFSESYVEHLVGPDSMVVG